MKKIATLTFHASHNYGSVLQAYALSKQLEIMGNKVEILNLRSQEQKRAYEIIPAGSMNVQKAFKYAIYPKLKRRFDEYERFINCVLPITKREFSSTDSLKYENPKYDVFICGGDQIWNPACVDFQKAYYLQFLPDNDKSVRISYAPSFGKSEFDEPTMENFRNWITKFDHISVREESGAKILKQVTDKPVKVVCDPVLLLEKKYWEEMAVKPKYNKPYILTYFLTNNHGDRSLLSWIKEKTGYEVVMLNEFIKDYAKPYHKAIDASPEEFIGLFLNASFVYTNSFHGTVFAAMFNKPFFTSVAKDKNVENNNDSRKIDFLKKMGLEDRIVTDVPKEKELKMDFSSANKKMRAFRAESLEFLENALKTEKKVMPLFSIIVPVYKVEEYLERCVNSILGQSFRDFELILVDDGSPDKCPEMCDDFAQKDKRISVIHKENGGVSSARNAGIESAKGKYIWFVDSDDAIEADSLCFLAEKIEKTHRDLYVFNAKFNEYIEIDDLDKLFRKYYFKYAFGFEPWNKIYSAEIIKSNNLKFDTEEKIGEDLLFNICTYCRIENIAVYNKKLYSYTVRETSAMSSKSKERHVNQMRLFGKIKKILKGKVPEETLAVLFIMHLVSGLNQSRQGGLTNKEYRELLKKYKAESAFDRKTVNKALNRFLDNEGASLLGKIRMRLLFLI